METKMKNTKQLEQKTLFLAVVLIFGFAAMTAEAVTCQIPPLSGTQLPEATTGFRNPLDEAVFSGYEYLQKTSAEYCKGVYKKPISVYHPGDDSNVKGTSCDQDKGRNIHAVADGVVVYVSDKKWGGVVTQHLYKGEVYFCQNAHSYQPTVTCGQTVTKGEVIANVGDVGTTCAHDHVSCWKSTRPNPTNGNFFCETCNGSPCLQDYSNVSQWYVDPYAFFATHGPYTSGGVGTVKVQARLNGASWSGTIYYELTGSAGFSGAMVPTSFSSAIGSYSLRYISGGPAGATFTQISPSPSQSLSVNGSITFSLDFTTQPPAPTIAWEFNGTTLAGWVPTNCGASVSNGIVYINPYGYDPYLIGPQINASASAYRYLEIRMSSNSVDPDAQLFFTTSSENFFSESKSVRFQVNNCRLCGNAAWRTYTIDMRQNSRWAGTILSIRIDPSASGDPNTEMDVIGLDYIRLKP
jgi:hypothetical protein